MSKTKPTAIERREYADLIEQRRKIEKAIRKANGNEPSRRQKIKTGTEAVLFGFFAANLVKSYLSGGDE